jgi:enamine deaminase RidA (YjgF/YER057c/UK114 family)
VSSEEQVIPNDVPTPLGNYVAISRAGSLGFVSGQFPVRNGRLVWTGRLGEQVDVQTGYAAAELAALNVLGQIKNVAGADWPEVRILKIDGYVASGPSFFDQPKVLDGASDLMVKILGARGAHARTAFAVTHLPGNAPIELAVTFCIGR